MVVVEITAGLLLDFEKLFFAYCRRGLVRRPESVLHDGGIFGFLRRHRRLIFLRVTEVIEFENLWWAVNVLVLFFGRAEILSSQFRHRVAKLDVTSDLSLRRVIFETFGAVDRNVGHRHVAELFL